MTAIILALLGKVWPYLIGAAGLAFAALRLRQSGAKAERAKQAQAEKKARDISDEIDDAVAGRTADENRERLRKWSAR